MNVLIILMVFLLAAVLLLLVALARVAEQQRRSDSLLLAELGHEVEHVTLRAMEAVTAAAGREVAVQVASQRREADVRDRSVAEHMGLRNAAIEQQMNALRGALADVAHLVGRQHAELSQRHGAMDALLQESVAVQGSLAEQTRGLREALSNPKVRGHWGERSADELLRQSGMVEGVSFLRQNTIDGGGRPDITFLLPQSKQLHMDVKFPADNYLRYLESENDTERQTSKAQFLKDVRVCMAGLRKRKYSDSEHSVGYVLLFFPNEAIYSFVLEHDHGVLDYAMEQRIVLCSPFTLFGVLSVIRHAVDAFEFEQRSEEILDRLVAFRSEWDKLSGHIDRLGSQLETVRRTYDEIAGPRRRAFARQFQSIADLDGEDPGPPNPIGSASVSSLPHAAVRAG